MNLAIKKIDLAGTALFLCSLTAYSYGTERRVSEEGGDWEARETAARIHPREESPEARFERLLAEAGHIDPKKQRHRKEAQEREAAELAQALEASKKEAETQKKLQEAREAEAREKELREARKLAEIAARQARELEEINKAIEAMERAAYEQELKKNEPFVAQFKYAISPEHKTHITVMRPAIVQQTDVECGYLSAINGAILYNTLQRLKIENRPVTQEALAPLFAMLGNQEKMQHFLTREQTRVCKKTLEDFDIISILDTYDIKLGSGAYTMVYDQLPSDIQQLQSLDKPIVEVLKKLLTEKNFTHIFFLRKAGADISGTGLGHWIAIVAHNNDNKSVDLYILDSQYPQGEQATYRKHRMNHDKMWQALVILLRQADTQLRMHKQVEQAD